MVSLSNHGAACELKGVQRGIPSAGGVGVSPKPVLSLPKGVRAGGWDITACAEGSCVKVPSRAEGNALQRAVRY